MRERRRETPPLRRALLLLSKVVAWTVVPLYAAGMIVTVWLENLLDAGGDGSYLENAGILGGVGAMAVVGGLLIAKRPFNTIGWILTSVALMFALFPAADLYAAYVISTRSGPDLLSVLAAWV